MTTMWLALTLFLIMYALLLYTDASKRWMVAFVFACLFVLFGFLPLDAVFGAISWNVIFMLLGTMAMVELFIESRMPSRLAQQLLQRVPNVKWAIIALCVFTGIVSAFIDNVATVLMIAPIGLAISRQLDINPVPVLISISVSSNLQGAATLVGDTTSILLGAYADMSFTDFFWFMGRPGIGFAVEIGALASVLALLYLFRTDTKPITSKVTTTVQDYMPSFLLLGMILALIIASQFENKPELTNGYLCMAFAAFGILYKAARERSFAVAGRIGRAIDYSTLLLLCSLFIVIAGITQAGVIDAISRLFVRLAGEGVGKMYVLLVLISVLLSAFVDNIPYVATMLPVVQKIAAQMGTAPYLFYFGLLIGATLGGNLTPIGASANIAGIGILTKAGYEVKARDFLRIGIPFTLLAVVSASAVIWLLYA